MNANALSSPESFYYFASLDGEDRKLWAQELLLDAKVYFRSREQLNDPNELRPSIVFEGTEKAMRDFVRHQIRTRWAIKLSPSKELSEVTRLVFKYRNSPMPEEALHEILGRVGVFCMSESSTDQLMWAHYAAGHRGIAFEFKADIGLFGAANKVVYKREKPVIYRLIDDSDAILEKCLLTKNIAWAYEQEWRVVARFKDETRIEQHIQQHRLSPAIEAFMREQHGPGHYLIPHVAIRSVILGSRVDKNTEEWLRSILDRAPRKIPVRKATLSRDSVVTIV